MKLHELIKEIVEAQPVAIIVISESEEAYNSRIYGRVEQEKVHEIIYDLAEQLKEETFNEIKKRLPF